MNLLIGFVIGFIVSEFVAGRKSLGRRQLIKSLRFKIKKGVLHIHHWAWCAILLGILVLVGFDNMIVLGIIAGALIQGMTYKDSFQFIYNHA